MRISVIKLLVCIIAGAIISGCGGTQEDKKSQPNSGSEQSKQNITNSNAPDYKSFTGKWLRSDGNYTIEVFSVSPEGKADAGYFNPGPINVEKAEWKINDNKLYFRIILKDVNYPGSNYTLEYIPQKDMLVGNYFQAVQGLNYDVTFNRVK